MKLKLAILVFMVLFTIVILPGGYSFWDEKLSIQGTILIDTPVEEITGPAILDESMLENTELQFEPAVLDKDTDLTGEIKAPAENTGEGTPSENNGEGTPAENTGEGTPAENTGEGTPAENTGEGMPSENTSEGAPAENTGDTGSVDTGDSTTTGSNGNNTEGSIPE